MRSLAFLLLFITSLSFGQNNFPEDWIGKYAGNMILANAKYPTDTIEVDFSFIEHFEDSAWFYKMTFHSAKYGEIVKDYMILSKTKGDTVNFILDERNGIKMELTMMNNCIYGMYEVLGSLYTTTMRKHGDNLFFDLFTASMNDPLLTEAQSGDETIEAKSFKPNVSQSVMLQPVND